MTYMKYHNNSLFVRYSAVLKRISMGSKQLKLRKLYIFQYVHVIKMFILSTYLGTGEDYKNLP